MRRRRQGSVYVMAILLVLVIAVAVVAVVDFSHNSYRSMVTSEQNRQLVLLAESGAARAYWEYVRNSAVLPATFNEEYANGSYAATISDNSSSLSRSVKIVCTASYKGKTASITRVMGNRIFDPGMFDGAIVSYGGLSTAVRIITGSGGENGDVYCDGSLSITGSGSALNGNAWARGSISSPLPSVTGEKKENSKALTVPSVSSTYFLPRANRLVLGNAVMNNVVFARANEIIFISGDLTMNGGTVYGVGTIVVTKKVYVKGHYSYSSTADKMAILAKDDISFTGALNVVGCFFADNRAIITSSTLYVTLGSLAAKSFTLGGNLTVIHDEDMLLDSELGADMRIPGYF